MKSRKSIWFVIVLALGLAVSTLGCGGIGTDVGNPEDFVGSYSNPAGLSLPSPSEDPIMADAPAPSGNPSAGDMDSSGGTSPSPTPPLDLPDCSDDASKTKSITHDGLVNGAFRLIGFFDYTGLPDELLGSLIGNALVVVESNSSITLACSGIFSGTTLNFICDITQNGITTECDLEVVKQ